MAIRGWILAGVMSCTLPACAGNEAGTDLELEIQHYRTACMSEGVQLCYLVATNGGEIELWRDEIAGFEFQWGYRYRLTVTRVAKQSHAADASSLQYRLKRQISQQRVAPSETFRLPLQYEGEQLVRAETGRCSYFGAIDIDPGQRACAQLQQLQSASFRHDPARPGLLLREQP